MRIAATFVVLGATLAGTVWGGPEHFPFAPFSQFSGSADNTGTFSALFLEGVRPSGATIRIPFADLGLRRAEVEEQIGRLGRDPAALLRHLGESYERFHPTDPMTELRLMRRVFRLEDGRDAGHRDELVARFTPA